MATMYQPSYARGDACKPRILFVEDNDISRELIRRIFQRMKHLEAHVAKDGSEALQFYDAHPYDIIFMDLQMPVMDGFEVTREIRNRDQLRGTYTPIVAVTAYVGDGDREMCKEAGMDGFLSKPINTDDLLQKIQQYIPCFETRSS